MWVKQLHAFLGISNVRANRRVIAFWFGLSLSFALVYSMMGLQQALGSEYVVQDDARQHVFWMQRFIDPALFPNDLIADYFQAVAPWGYRLIYWLPAQFGIDPLLWNKFLPIFLNLITAGFCFGVCLELLPTPFGAFSGTVLLAQSLGFTATVVSGAQKAFIYPLFVAFIYFFLKQRLLATLIIITLQGLFYPPILLITAVTLFIRLFCFMEGKLQLIPPSKNRLFSVLGLAIAIIAMLPFALKTNEFGPVITLEEAQQLPEFLAGGRSQFFFPDDISKFWLKGRSGLRLASGLTPVTNALGILLPILILFPKTFPLTKQLSRNLILLPQILLSSGIMFVAAHLLLFQLHLPSRYTQHSFRIVFSITAGLVIIILIDAAFQISKKTTSSWIKTKVLPSAIVTILGTPLLCYPLLLDGFPITVYLQGNTPQLYTFLQQQPRDSMIASTTGEVNNIPTFAQRSILVGSEYAIPYHWGYYKQFRQRTLDLITAQYSPNLNEVKTFIDRYSVDFWMIERGTFSVEYIDNNQWLQQFQPATSRARSELEKGVEPLINSKIEACTVLETKRYFVLNAQCIADP